MPLSSALVYLVVGLGPLGGLLDLDLVRDAALIERVACDCDALTIGAHVVWGMALGLIGEQLLAEAE